jgi:hypothetical protein
MKVSIKGRLAMTTLKAVEFSIYTWLKERRFDRKCVSTKGFEKSLIALRVLSS